MAAPRRWQGKDGMFETQASFISVFQRTKVKLQKVSGGVIAVPIQRLSDLDVDYLISLFGFDEWNRLTGPSSTSPSSRHPQAPTIQPFDSKSTPLEFSPCVSPPSASRSLSLRRAQYQPKFAPSSTIINHSKQHTLRSLLGLPTKVIVGIGHHLDVRSRLELSRTCRRAHAAIMVRDVWNWIDFTQNHHHKITDGVFQKLTHLLLRFQLHYAPRHVVLDHTNITAQSIGTLLKYFPAIQSLSLRHCPLMDYRQLTNTLETLTCRLDISAFGMISKATPIHGDDIKRIRAALEHLAEHTVRMDCDVCDQCKVSACTPTLTCLLCGDTPLKRCKACAPTCDRCHARFCHQHPPMMARLDCGKCDRPLFLCDSCKGHGGGGCPTHGIFHSRCRKSMCTGCGVMACPICDLAKCGGGCHSQWCPRCAPQVNLQHCKCILIHGMVGSKMSKRLVCGHCRKTCQNCVSSIFCTRCLDIHQDECMPSTLATKKKGSGRKS